MPSCSWPDLREENSECNCIQRIFESRLLQVGIVRVVFTLLGLNQGRALAGTRNICVPVQVHGGSRIEEDRLRMELSGNSKGLGKMELSCEGREEQKCERETSPGFGSLLPHTPIVFIFFLPFAKMDEDRHRLGTGYKRAVCCGVPRTRIGCRVQEN
jgi:hypothetical protein